MRNAGGVHQGFNCFHNLSLELNGLYVLGDIIEPADQAEGVAKGSQGCFSKARSDP